jgi:hypothetical protein
MSKKMMLLALTALSATMLVPSAIASAQEIHIDGITSFSGGSGQRTLTAAEQPTITCAKSQIFGSFDAGSTTTGKFEIDYTECHVKNPLGITYACRSTGSILTNTIKTSGTFHLITINNKPGILLTMTPTGITCETLATMNFAGNVIGTITSPACESPSKFLTFKFNATGSTQEHKTYTGVNYNLTSQIGSGPINEVGLIEQMTLESETAGKITCT